jgi:hypothetical protein
MPSNYFDDLSDAGLFAEDKARREATAKACDAHLKDLQRVHGPHPDRRLKGVRKARAPKDVAA